jgi:hypothetical protein
MDARMQLGLLQTEVDLWQLRRQPSLAEENALDYERLRAWSMVTAVGRFVRRLAGVVVVGTCLASLIAAPDTVTFRGMCDASAGVALDPVFFVAANDEDNVLRIYSREDPGRPSVVVNLNKFLRLSKGSRETDIEGGAWLEGKIYWITSHGRNAEGKPAANRRRFFATTVRRVGGWPVIEPFGRPCTTLLDQLAADSRMAGYALTEAARRAPKAPGALNIEGLCTTPDGALLIGFRNPIPGGLALLVPVLNAAVVVAGQPARFGDPIQLDLDGLGIRDLLWRDGRYLVIAGAHDGAGAMRLYEWDGGGAAPRWLRTTDFGDTTPEALLAFPGDDLGRLLFLSDDGTWPVGCTECKKLKDSNLKHFRALSLIP